MDQSREFGNELAMRVDVVAQSGSMLAVLIDMRREAAGCFDIVPVYSLTCCKDTQMARRRPSNLTIVPPDHQQFTPGPLSSPYNAAIVSSTSSFMAVFNDMLRSPTLSAAVCPRSASVHNPRPTWPGSSSLPATPNLPVELPGSLLQHNQGFPHLDAAEFAPSRPTSQNIRRGTHPPDKRAENEGDVFDLLYLFPEPLNHSKSVPSLNLGYRENAMKSSRSGTTPNPSAINKSNPHRVHHRKALSDIEWRTLGDSKTVSGSNVAEPSTPVHGNPGNSSNMSRIDFGELLQPPPLAFEAAASDNTFERRTSRRDHVSTDCFSIVMCSVVKFALCMTKRFQVARTYPANFHGMLSAWSE